MKVRCVVFGHRWSRVWRDFWFRYRECGRCGRVESELP